MNWYLSVIKDNYLNFSGRARRSEYWYFILFNTIIAMALFVVSIYVPALFYIYSIYALATLLPGLAVAVRRLHDINKSGAFILLAFVPLLNIWLIILLATEGTQGPNEYGEDPKMDYPDMNEIGRPETTL